MNDKYVKVMMLKHNHKIIAIPLDKRMELYLYYWWLNLNKAIKQSLNMELLFDEMHVNNIGKILDLNSNLRTNKDLVFLNKIIHKIYQDKNLYTYNTIDLKEHIKTVKLQLSRGDIIG